MESSIGNTIYSGNFNPNYSQLNKFRLIMAHLFYGHTIMQLSVLIH